MRSSGSSALQVSSNKRFAPVLPASPIPHAIARDASSAPSPFSAAAAAAAERKLKDKNTDKSTSVRPLLKRLKLERFAASFEESGYGTLATACKVPLTLLEALGMERGDRRLLLTGLARGE